MVLHLVKHERNRRFTTKLDTTAGSIRGELQDARSALGLETTRLQDSSQRLDLHAARSDERHIAMQERLRGDLLNLEQQVQDLNRSVQGGPRRPEELHL